MRKISISALVCVAVLLSGHMHAQSLDSLPFISGRTIQMDGAYTYPLQKRDSILIGDHIIYGFILEDMGNEAFLNVPILEGDPRGGLEPLSEWKIDTLNIRDSKDGSYRKYDIKGEMVLTSFDEGVFELPPLPILRISRDLVVDTLLFDPVAPLEIKTMPVDTATFQPIGMKGQIRYPLTADEIVRLLYIFHLLVILILFLIFGTYLLITRRRTTAIRKKDLEPVHVFVLRLLNSYTDSKKWSPESQKKSYSAITDAMRMFIEDRYGISATEMTTTEIFNDKLIRTLDKDKTNELKEMFNTADLVKFAKYTASDVEVASVIPTAIAFVSWSLAEAEKTEESGIEVKTE